MQGLLEKLEILALGILGIVRILKGLITQCLVLKTFKRLLKR